MYFKSANLRLKNVFNLRICGNIFFKFAAYVVLVTGMEKNQWQSKILSCCAQKKISAAPI